MESVRLQVSSQGRIAHESPGIRHGTVRYSVGDGFFFHRQRIAGGRVYLRCVGFRSNPPCLVRAIMFPDNSHFEISSGVHNHAPDVYHARILDLRNRLLEACRARPNARVEVVYHDVCRR